LSLRPTNQPQVFFLSDIIRAKVLHWNKKTFFPELLASPPQTEDGNVQLSSSLQCHTKC
jgi:hypothetical protein